MNNLNNQSPKIRVGGSSTVRKRLDATNIDKVDLTDLAKVVNDNKSAIRVVNGDGKGDGKEERYQVGGVSVDEGGGFDINQFIPTVNLLYVFPPEVLDLVSKLDMMGDNLYFYGPTGCGKSEFVIQFHAHRKKPIVRLNAHNGINAEDFIGDMQLMPGPPPYTEFIPGILPMCMKYGMSVLVDEADFLSPELAQVLHPVLEKNARRLTLPKLKVTMEAHPDFRIYFTGNTAGKGDDSNSYVGTKLLNDAFMDRLLFIGMDYLDSKMEKNLIKKAVPDLADSDVKILQEIAKKVREANQQQQIVRTCSIRKLIEIARKVPTFGVKKAYELVLLNGLAPEEQLVVKGLVDRIEGVKV